MKTFFESHPERRFLLLAGIVVVAIAFLVHQVRRQLQLRDSIVATGRFIKEAEQTEASIRAKEKWHAEQAALLSEYEVRIPEADNGFIWISRIVRDAAPALSARISPPELDDKEAPVSGDYCCGTFAVHGTGRMEELLQILQKIEADLPFARVRDLQLSVDQEFVNFSFSLMAVMRLNQD